MHALCRTDELAAALESLSSNAPPRSSDRVVIRTEGNTILIALTRDGGFTRRRVPATIVAPGTAVVAALTLRDVAARAQMSYLEIRQRDSGELTFMAVQGEPRAAEPEPAREVATNAPPAVAVVRARWPARLRLRWQRRTSIELALATCALPAVLLAGIAYLPLPQALRTLSLMFALVFASLIPIVEGRARGARILELGIAVAIVYVLLFPYRAFVVLLELPALVTAGVQSAPLDVLRRSLLVATLALLAGGIAYISPVGVWAGRRITVPRVRRFEQPGVWLPMALCVVGATAWLIGISGRLPATSHLGFSRSSGLVSTLVAFLLVGLALLARRATLERTRRATAIAVAAIAGAVALAVFGQFKEMGAFAIGVPLLAWAMTSGRRLRARAILAVVAAGVLVFVLVSAARFASDRLGTKRPLRVAAAMPTQLYRYDWISGARRAHFRPWSPVLDTSALVSDRFYGYDVLVLAVAKTPSRVPYQHGATLMNLVEGFVPRVLWPSKPGIGLGVWYAEQYWGVVLGEPVVPQSMTHVAEFWIDFGWLGVLVGMAVLGFLYRFIVAALRPWESGTAMLLYAIVFVTAIRVDGDIPLVYVTLVQRLAAVAVLAAAIAVIDRARLRLRAA